MPGKNLLILLIVAVLSTFGNLPATALDVYVNLYSDTITGGDGVSFVPLWVTLYNKKGAEKAYQRTSPDGSGQWRIRFENGARIVPGDRIVVNQPSVHEETVVEDIVITKINPAKDVIAGRFSSRRTDNRALVVQWYVTAIGWRGTAIAKEDFPVDADGRFRLKTTNWTDSTDLKRSNSVSVGYQDGVFFVRQFLLVPGLEVDKGRGTANLKGQLGQDYTADLLDPSGALKASCDLNIGPDSGDNVEIYFDKASGRPVNIGNRDTIRVRGKWGFSMKIKTLNVTVHTESNAVEIVKAIPGRHVLITVSNINPLDGSVSDIDTMMVQTDGNGHALGIFPPFERGDYILVEFNDNQGNLYRYRTFAP